jgi:hypothetical protein
MSFKFRPQQTKELVFNIPKIRQVVRENRRLTVRSIAEQVNFDRETDKLSKVIIQLDATMRFYSTQHVSGISMPETC